MKKYLLHIIFVQALIATLGSLYYSNFGDPVANLATGELFNAANGFDPCDMCWWARILMYPIVVISGLGLIMKDKNALKYILFLAVSGVGLEIYHYLLQKTTFFSTSQICTLQNPCTAMSVDYLGFITIPFLCLMAFVVILGLTIWGLRTATTQKMKNEE